jgi:hypothetical protein
VGLLTTSWSYLWRTTPMHRREVEGAWEDDRPPEVEAPVSREGIQEPRDGVGPLLHRHYSTRIVDGRMTGAELIAEVAADPNRVVPGGLAKFKKTHGEEGRMAVGDEWTVRMPGPWNGPVRVVDTTPTSFRFATLGGHLEAGQIEWHAHDDGGDVLFGVESWARSGDQMSDILHNRLRMAREVQLHMWTSVVERAARRAGGRMAAGVDIETRRVDPEDLPAGARSG